MAARLVEWLSVKNTGKVLLIIYNEVLINLLVIIMSLIKFWYDLTAF